MTPIRTAVLLLFATSLAADPLMDVRSALQKLTGREPIHATYEMQHAIANDGRFDNDKFSGKASVELEADASGFRIVFPRPLLDQMDREQLTVARDPKQKSQTVTALSEIDPVATSNAVDFAPELLRMLEGAKLLSDGAGTFQGKGVRVMVLRLPDRLDDDDAKRVKIAENKLTLWLGSDLVPVGAEHLLNAKFSFLIFKGETKQKRSWYFAHVTDRLVRVRHESTSTSSGMGQNGNESVVATVRVH
ncbi:MAG TPA: hypothetical protein VJZ00_17270 [Thermoanaerobaculia bacterium]|nr:hypothetical protein [Thermoanaerobaculia bacterium]